jgi:putative ABC transport system ATP-binding protein
MSAVVVAREVERSFNSGTGMVEVLRGVDLYLEPGELVALYGPSGSGKTTLLNLIGALDYPSSGEIRVRGEEITRISEHNRAQLRRRHISFIFQNNTLIDTYTAAENIDLALRLVLPRLSYRQRQERTDVALQVVGLSNWAKHMPDQLSGGQKQRVAIARALAQRLDLVLADEPTNGLDTRSAQRVLTLFQSLARTQGTAFVIVSHDPQVIKFVDKAYDLNEGRLVLREHEKELIS